MRLWVHSRCKNWKLTDDVIKKEKRIVGVIQGSEQIAYNRFLGQERGEVQQSYPCVKHQPMKGHTTTPSSVWI